MIQLGQYPAPSHTIAHISDTHLLAGGRPLYGKVTTIEHLGCRMGDLVSGMGDAGREINRVLRRWYTVGAQSDGLDVDKLLDVHTVACPQPKQHVRPVLDQSVAASARGR